MLTRSAWIAAAFVGACALGGGSWRFAIVLLAFFVPAMLLSRFGRERKRALADVAKSGARDERQVLANGGVAALCALASAFAHQPLLAAAFAGSFAAAASDTWGTEIGTLVRTAPRSILTWRRLPPGMSGGVTAAGTAAEFLGAAVVAVAASALHVCGFWPVCLGGFAGALIDSVAGASLQELRFCPACSRDCETNPHECGTATQLRRGFAWMDNDAVNLAATLAGAAAAAGLTLVL